MRRLTMLSVGLICATGLSAQNGGERRAYEEMFYASGKLRIQAYVYKPEGVGPFPVVIYNHGSRPGAERMQRPFAYIGSMLAHSSGQNLQGRGAGYIVVVP